MSSEPYTFPARSRLLALVVLLVAAGGLARFWDLGRMVVWHDEVFSVIRVLGFDHGSTHDALFNAGRDLSADDLQRFQKPEPSRTWGDTWRALISHPEHAPLYYLLARLAVAWNESAVVGMRAVSAALSLLLLPAMAWLAREIFGRGPAPWLTVILVAVSPVHLLYAQEARQYALWSALVAASSAALLRALRRRRDADWVIYGLLLMAALYSHLLTALLAGCHALYVLWRTLDEPGALRATTGRFAVATAGALLLFLPWLAVVLSQLGEMQKFIGWMAAPAGIGQLASAWVGHLARPFVDLPELPMAWLGVLPLLALAARVAIRQRGTVDYRLVGLLVLLPLALVALPDLLVGGRRSLESRYLMPTFLGLELLVAGTLASAWDTAASRRRVVLPVLTLLVAGGLASQWRILGSESWWTKSYSAHNAEFARLVNAAQLPLILASDGSVNLGELISLSYHLLPHVRLRLLPIDGRVDIPPGYTSLFALLPGEKLRQQLGRDHDLETFPGTWQWYTVTPVSASRGQR